MKKIFGSTFGIILFSMLFMQVQGVLAGKDDHKPITSPVTSPVTSPLQCKPGWGFGDKNHCHFGPPGLENKDNDQGQDNNHHGDNTDKSDEHHGNSHH